MQKYIVLFIGLLIAMPLCAATPEISISIENKNFIPKTLDIPAGQRIKLIITNKDSIAAEFESHQLNREKVIPAKGQSSLSIGPLKPGTYAFFNDFDPTVIGTIVVK